MDIYAVVYIHYIFMQLLRWYRNIFRVEYRERNWTEGIAKKKYKGKLQIRGKLNGRRIPERERERE
jgi:hypothetical protein